MVPNVPLGMRTARPALESTSPSGLQYVVEWRILKSFTYICQNSPIESFGVAALLYQQYMLQIFQAGILDWQYESWLSSNSWHLGPVRRNFQANRIWCDVNSCWEGARPLSFAICISSQGNWSGKSPLQFSVSCCPFARQLAWKKWCETCVPESWKYLFDSLDGRDNFSYESFSH